MMHPPNREDRDLFDDIADVYQAVDPVPPTLAERVRFALALESADFEVLRSREEPTAAVRGDGDIRTITFDGEALTVMISIRARDEHTVRVDGWLAPPGAHLVELRTRQGPAHTARADDQGRFALDGVPCGLTQLVVRQGLDDPAQAAILAVTTSLML